MEIRRFGVGNRRPDGPPRTIGVAGQVIHSDRRGTVTELAFARGASIEPHTNPNTTWLLVIEGGGWVQVGEDRARVAPGEAILWPADLVHGAWTELSEMRAIAVEFAGPDDAHIGSVLDGVSLPLPATGLEPRHSSAAPEALSAPPDARRSSRDGEPS